MGRDQDWVYPAAVFVAAQYGAGMILASTLDFEPRPQVIGYMVLAGVAAVLGGAGFLVYLVAKLYRAGETRPTAAIGSLIRANWPGILIVAAGFQLVTLQWASMAWLKQMMPMLTPFWADPHLVAIDRALFGQDPWRYLHPALDPLSSLIDLTYGLWFPIKAAVMGAVLSCAPCKLKTQSMLAYFLAVGVAGVAGQFALSSAGPIFYDRLGLDSAFADLPIAPIAGAGADYLWQGYASGVAEIGGGISAMPSIHVAMAAWIALTVTAIWRPLAWLGWTFFAFILVGSVYLGWHYAVDGIAGTAAMVGAWALAGRIAEGVPLASWFKQKLIDPTPPGACPSCNTEMLPEGRDCCKVCEAVYTW